VTVHKIAGTEADRRRQLLPGYGALRVGGMRGRRWNAGPAFLICSLAFLALSIAHTQGLLH
jgi:hypothetical protein